MLVSWERCSLDVGALYERYLDVKLKQVKDTWMLSQGGFSPTALTLSVGHQLDSDDRPNTLLVTRSAQLR